MHVGTTTSRPHLGAVSTCSCLDSERNNLSTQTSTGQNKKSEIMHVHVCYTYLALRCSKMCRKTTGHAEEEWKLCPTKILFANHRDTRQHGKIKTENSRASDCNTHTHNNYVNVNRFHSISIPSFINPNSEHCTQLESTFCVALEQYTHESTRVAHNNDCEPKRRFVQFCCPISNGAWSWVRAQQSKTDRPFHTRKTFSTRFFVGFCSNRMLDINRRLLFVLCTHSVIFLIKFLWLMRVIASRLQCGKQ